MAPPSSLRRVQSLTVNEPNPPASLLLTMRNQLAVFQEPRGIPREPYTFMALMSSIMALGAQSAYAVMNLVFALVPLGDVLFLLARFTLERILDIIFTFEKQDKAIKVVVFSVQFMIALFVVIFVYFSIIIPVSAMGLMIVKKPLAIVYNY